MKTISVLLYSTALVFAQGVVSAQDIDRPVAEWIDVPERAAAITWYGDGLSVRTEALAVYILEARTPRVV